jgi:hypothetical protein
MLQKSRKSGVPLRPPPAPRGERNFRGIAIGSTFLKNS